MPSPGGRPFAAVNAATAGATSARIAVATATPSRTRAAMSSCLRFEPPQRFGPAEDHELVAAADHRVGFGVECHAQIAALKADDDHAETLAQVRVENRLV